MRRLTVPSGEEVVLRNGEIDWFPSTLHGYTSHLLVNDEDFCPSKKEKHKLRRANRKLKKLGI